MKATTTITEKKKQHPSSRSLTMNEVIKSVNDAKDEKDEDDFKNDKVIKKVFQFISRVKR